MLQSASPTYRLFRAAILRERQVVCTYSDLRRELCPLIIGHDKDGAEAVLAFQFGGESSKGQLRPGGAWRCLKLSEVRDAVLRDGPWHEGGEHGREQRCVVDVDLDVNIQVRKRRNPAS